MIRLSLAQASEAPDEFNHTLMGLFLCRLRLSVCPTPRNESAKQLNSREDSEAFLRANDFSASLDLDILISRRTSQG